MKLFLAVCFVIYFYFYFYSAIATFTTAIIIAVISTTVTSIFSKPPFDYFSSGPLHLNSIMSLLYSLATLPCPHSLLLVVTASI